MTAATKSGKRQPKQTKLDRILAQGTTIDVDIDGRRAIFFKMPTAELQTELNEELDKSIKKRLKADGFERICATRREHPLQSELLRVRIDALAFGFDPRLNSEEGLADLRKEYDAMIGDPALTFQSCPFSQEDADWFLAKHIKDALAAWAAGFENYRDMRKNAWYWRGTKAWDVIFPPDGPTLPDGQPPKPVWLNKQRHELVVQLRNIFVDLYLKVGVVVPA
jgi:hypothetical protein